MNYLGKVINNCKYIYNEINAATLTGAIDVVVVEQPDGSYTCSPFHVRFGKIGVLRSKEKVVDIEINGEPVDIHMKLGESGEAFFVEEVIEGEEDHFIPPHLACSPIPPDGDRCWHRLGEDDEDENEVFKVEERLDEVEAGNVVEFRPISETEQPIQSKSHFNKEDSLSADETVTVTVSKRKRRKKSIKKKNAQKRNSTPCVLPNEPGLEPSTDPIFMMEDVDNGPRNKEVETISQLNTVTELPVERDIHFFSDTEITPGSSPREEGEFAPVQSDTEFETKRLVTGGEGKQKVTGDDHAQSWRWGELPSHEPDDPSHDSQRWMLHNMLGFMKKTKHIRHKNESEGIYLSEVNSEDPEMVALYFPNTYRQATNPNNREFAERSREEDAESGNGPSLPQSPHSVEGSVCGPKHVDFENKWFPEDISISLCGTENPQLFQESIVTFNDLVSDPAITNNPKLVIKLDGKIYSWQNAAPLILSLFVFRKPLPEETMSRLTGEVRVDKEEKEKTQRKVYYSSWFNWSRINQQNYGQVKEEQCIVQSSLVDKNEGTDEVTTQVPIEPLDLTNRLIEDNKLEKYRKSLRLSSQQIAKLKLRPGANELEFSVTTAYQGTSRCKCFLFCWRYDDKIVVSDIDGTITKSDVLGHILPIVGKDWAQSGVAKLFTKIKENGYKLLYLSARAIGQSRVTREYLKSIKQEDLTLPEGPMLLNPTSLLNAFHTEVIEKKPEEFKISCLRDIQALFPAHIKPFYAGYGNKINDVWAYQAVGIPIFRIFTINHRGELKHELTQTFQSTYFGQSRIVNDLFPPLPEGNS